MLYEKDKSVRLTVRVNPRMFAFVKRNADILGTSPSDFVRMLIRACMASSPLPSDTNIVDTDDTDDVAPHLEQNTDLL